LANSRLFKRASFFGINAKSPATGDQVTHECVSGLDALKGLLQVDDVNVVALTKDEATHLGVPTTGLVTEVNSGFQ
jgi:hypothetical protein